MLRSAQMLVAQALLVHYFGRDWSLYSSLRGAKECNVYRELVCLFNDRPSAECPLGIHKLLELADRKAARREEGGDGESRVGTWFGPTSISLLMRDALNEFGHACPLLADKLRIYVAQDCIVYKRDVLDMCTGKSQITTATTTIGHDRNNNNRDETPTAASFTPCLILVSMRLGSDEQLNEVYINSLKACLDMDKCVGIIGGKPRHSLYFFGYQGLFCVLCFSKAFF